jgi:hypothetical protein
MNVNGFNFKKIIIDSEETIDLGSVSAFISIDKYKKKSLDSKVSLRDETNNSLFLQAQNDSVLEDKFEVETQDEFNEDPTITKVTRETEIVESEERKDKY